MNVGSIDIREVLVDLAGRIIEGSEGNKRPTVKAGKLICNGCMLIVRGTEEMCSSMLSEYSKSRRRRC
jgi:hypothetical protein